MEGTEPQTRQHWSWDQRPLRILRKSHFLLPPPCRVTDAPGPSSPLPGHMVPPAVPTATLGTSPPLSPTLPRWLPAPHHPSLRAKACPPGIGRRGGEPTRAAGACRPLSRPAPWAPVCIGALEAYFLPQTHPKGGSWLHGCPCAGTESGIQKACDPAPALSQALPAPHTCLPLSLLFLNCR